MKKNCLFHKKQLTCDVNWPRMKELLNNPTLLLFSFYVFISASNMNWKLLLIALCLIVEISARPAEDSQSSESTLNASPEVTDKLTEKANPTTEAIAATTAKATTSPRPTATSATELPSTVRYFLASLPTKPTNPRNKYNNNYANLITKHTLNNNRTVSNSDGNVSSSNSNNEFVSVHGMVVDSSMPVDVLTSSATTSNSSSKPLVFVDADENATITTRRAFFQVNPNNDGTWSNFHIESPNTVPTTRKKKPVIHKIISKWSDNPNEVFNLHGGHSMLTTQSTEINGLKDHLVQNSFKPGRLPSFDQLPAFLGEQLFQQQATTYKPASPPATSVINVFKKPAEGTMINCKKVKIKFGNAIANKNEFSSKESCDDINIQIDNKLHNINSQTTDDYTVPNNDKFEDSTNDYHSEEKNDLAEIETQSPQIINSISQITKPQGTVKFGDKDKDKNKKKKPGGGILAAQTEEEDGSDGTDVGSMVMTMMTMMAVFNPLNFGVWGIVMAPMAAMLFGGIAFAMFQFMNHPMTKHGWQPQPAPWPAPWPKPQEIVIKNKIKHSPIPIKVMHLHKHAPSPPLVVSEPVHSYGPPIMSIKPPMDSYGPPVMSYKPPVQPSQSYGEPPIDDYHPSAPSGGPYKRRKTNIQFKPLRPLRVKPLVKTRVVPTRPRYKFKLL